MSFLSHPRGRAAAADAAVSAAGDMGAVSETALAAVTAAASASMAICRRRRRRSAAVGTWEGVRALVWLEKDRVVGWEDGSRRDRYVEVVGEATCCLDWSGRREDRWLVR